MGARAFRGFGSSIQAYGQAADARDKTSLLPFPPGLPPGSPVQRHKDQKIVSKKIRGTTLYEAYSRQIIHPSSVFSLFLHRQSVSVDPIRRAGPVLGLRKLSLVVNMSSTHTPVW